MTEKQEQTPSRIHTRRRVEGEPKLSVIGRSRKRKGTSRTNLYVLAFDAEGERHVYGLDWEQLRRLCDEIFFWAYSND